MLKQSKDLEKANKTHLQEEKFKLDIEKPSFSLNNDGKRVLHFQIHAENKIYYLY